jgi:hypothetical protein
MDTDFRRYGNSGGFRLPRFARNGYWGFWIPTPVSKSLLPGWR